MATSDLFADLSRTLLSGRLFSTNHVLGFERRTILHTRSSAQPLRRFVKDVYSGSHGNAHVETLTASWSSPMALPACQLEVLNRDLLLSITEKPLTQ